jgi:hypothetical protein
MPQRKPSIQELIRARDTLSAHLEHEEDFALAEREAIVKWLRVVYRLNGEVQGFADAIENGEHHAWEGPLGRKGSGVVKEVRSTRALAGDDLAWLRKFARYSRVIATQPKSSEARLSIGTTLAIEVFTMADGIGFSIRPDGIFAAFEFSPADLPTALHVLRAMAERGWTSIYAGEVVKESDWVVR